ncbi:MAG TPA: hemolysin family protein [Candidatus Polarisedimenticolaceae bacterium]|nr:hemolysin family protein [Candidatus Polarisedimenticolaceae bacterium]
MSGTAWLLLAGALLLLLLYLALSVTLTAVASLNRVVLRRMVQDGQGPVWLEELRNPASEHRLAAQLARQAALLAAVLLTGFAGQRAGATHPWLLAGGTGLAAVVLLDTWGARLLVQLEPRQALRATLWLLPLLRVVLFPLVVPLAAVLARGNRVPAGGDDEEEQEEQVEAFFEVGEREGILEADEGRMMRSIAFLDDTRVREIMTPRVDILALSADTSVADARAAMIAAGHSRMPVYRGAIDDIVGILHVRDLVRAWEQGREAATIAGYVRPAFFVPETLTVAELLREMRVRTHVAIVVDEYGGVAGLVTLEDLLEEIVGDIRDEHETEEALVQQDSDGSWLVHGLAHVDELMRIFGFELEERDFDTVGGLVVSTLGRVPEPGERLRVGPLAIEVVHADPRRVYRVRIRAEGGPDKLQGAQASA